MPGCQRCHVRLNAPVQGLEDHTKRHMNSPGMVCALQAPTLVWQSASGTSSTNEEYPIPQTTHVQPLTFKTAFLSTRTKVRRFVCPWDAVLSDMPSFVIRHLAVSNGSFFDSALSCAI